MNRSEIWLVNLDPTFGDEIRKTRPAIIISENSIGLLALRVVVPITDWKPIFGAAEWMVKIEPDNLNNLSKTSAADCFQIRSVSKMRIVRKLGHLSAAKMADLELAVKAVLKL